MQYSKLMWESDVLHEYLTLFRQALKKEEQEAHKTGISSLSETSY